MPHRVLRAAMLERVSRCCSAPEDAEKVVEDLIRMGVRLPSPIITDVAELDSIPDGSAVLVGDPREQGAAPVVGMKGPHCIYLAGEDEAWPFHSAALAPPLPCTLVWVPGEEVEHLPTMAERADGVGGSLLMQELNGQDG